MHKKLILNQLGGAPVGVLDTLAFWQTGLQEALGSLYSDAGATVIVAGVKAVGSGLTAGWIFQGGELIPFEGFVQAGGFVPPGYEYKIVVGETKTQKEYEDGILRDLYSSKVASYQLSPTGTGTGVKLADCIRLETLLGTRAMDSALAGSQDLSTLGLGAALGSPTGTINYRLNRLTRLLQVDGSITFTSPATITDPPIIRQLFTLPAGFAPAKRAPFEALVRYHSGTVDLFKDAAGDDVIRSLYCEITNAGSFNVGIIRPDAAVASYTVHINHLLSID